MPDILNRMRWTPKQIAVLRALAEAPAPLSVAEAAAHTDEPVGSVFSIIQRMKAWRFVTETDARGTGGPARLRYRYDLTRRGRIEASKRCGVDVPRETKEPR